MATLDLHANDLILFAHIVAAGSFTRAAVSTGLPKSTLSRRLSELEDRLGERLMQRSTRRLVLTEFGERMLEHAQRLVDAAEAASEFASYRRAGPRGTLRVALPPDFQELSLLRVVEQYAARYPEMRLELDLSPRRVDLLAERFDVAIRAATRLPDDATLVARRIITLQNGLYANPEYLARRGEPTVPADLLEHVGLVLLAGDGVARPWVLSRDGERWEGIPREVIRSNSLQLQRALATEGLGIVGLSEHFAEAPVAAGTLAPVLPGWLLPPTVIWCVTPGRQLLPRRTTAFIEVLKEVLAGEKAGRDERGRGKPAG